MISVGLFKKVKSHIKLWGDEEQGGKYCLFVLFIAVQGIREIKDMLNNRTAEANKEASNCSVNLVKG